ncbi:MAG: hypothetical protein SOR74_07580, partial [Candidatus Faecivicinus sp.]|nr:hypothetical protein [Candidatus Faecivicinus sp.]
MRIGFLLYFIVSAHLPGRSHFSPRRALASARYFINHYIEIACRASRRMPLTKALTKNGRRKRGCEKTPQEDKKGFGARKRDKSFFVWYNLVEMKTTPRRYYTPRQGK